MTRSRRDETHRGGFMHCRSATVRVERGEVLVEPFSLHVVQHGAKLRPFAVAHGEEIVLELCTRRGALTGMSFALGERGKRPVVAANDSVHRLLLGASERDAGE